MQNTIFKTLLITACVVSFGSLAQAQEMSRETAIGNATNVAGNTNTVSGNTRTVEGNTNLTVQDTENGNGNSETNSGISN